MEFGAEAGETLALPTDAVPFERIVGVPLKSYVSFTWTYHFAQTQSVRIKTFLCADPVSTKAHYSDSATPAIRKSSDSGQPRSLE
jgi:hypothetical protein